LTLWRLGEDLWFQGKTTNQAYTYGKLHKLLYPKITYFVLGILFGIYAATNLSGGNGGFLSFLFATLVGLAIATIPCGVIAGKRESAVLATTTTPDMVLAK
jgi:hypothetical protein